jgi:hypothetical protein
MRPRHSTRLTALVLLLTACGIGPAAAGWQGTDVHLVDGTWIGTETVCGDGDDAIECRAVVERAMAALAPEVRPSVVRAALAALPTTFVTASGETRTARLSAGISTREAVVIDLAEGTRRVIGYWCYLPSTGDGDLVVESVTCEMNPSAIEYWRDGNAPPSFPPGTHFG